MRLHRSSATSCMLAAISVLLATAAVADQPRHLPTTRDAIEMTIAVSPQHGFPTGPDEGISTRSPDGQSLVALLQRGEVETNANVYSILLWKARDIQQQLFSPTSLLELRSSTNLPAVHAITWSHDSESLWFVGANPAELQQVYALDLKSKLLRRLTNHPTDVLDFSQDRSGNRIAFVAKRAPVSLWNDETRRNGIIVSDFPSLKLTDFILGQRGAGATFDRDEVVPTDLFYSDEKGTKQIPLRAQLPAAFTEGRGGGLSISPDGLFIVVATDVPPAEIPPQWQQYQDGHIRHQFLYSTQPGISVLNGVGESEWSFLERHTLVDVRRDKTTVLLNSPVSSRGRSKPAVWAPDSKSVVLSSVFLPLTISEVAEQQIRSTSPVTVEVDIGSGAIHRIGDACLRAVRWEASSNELLCQGESDSSLIRFRKTKGRWQQTGSPASVTPDIVLRQDLHNPPKLYARGIPERGELLVADLNPQLSQVELSKLEEISWEWTRGRQTQAGLYYPVGYDKRHRYPMVIQTHGWTKDRFEMEGFETSGYAARALTSKGFFVLQVSDIIDSSVVPPREEIDNALLVYRSAIELLAARGMVDPDRVGILGFSRTSDYVAWALTTQPSLFAAAVNAEAIGGYASYMSRHGAGSFNVTLLYGAPPFGESLKRWMASEPSFNLAQVRTPLRMSAFTPFYLPTTWEWFEGLQLLKKPVELVMLQNGFHMLRKPAERMTVSGGNVDWFDFWLNGREDPDPAKQVQYLRWRELRQRTKS